MSDIYWQELSEAKVRDAIVRGRFVFLDRHGKTSDTNESTRPLGVYYYDCDLGSAVNRGWVQYADFNYSQPVYLELASGVDFDQVITYQSDGKGIPALRGEDSITGYALATEEGDAGDLIHVLVALISKPITHAFSNGLDYYNFQ